MAGVGGGRPSVAGEVTGRGEVVEEWRSAPSGDKFLVTALDKRSAKMSRLDSAPNSRLGASSAGLEGKAWYSFGGEGGGETNLTGGTVETIGVPCCCSFLDDIAEGGDLEEAFASARSVCPVVNPSIFFRPTLGGFPKVSSLMSISGLIGARLWMLVPDLEPVAE